MCIHKCRQASHNILYDTSLVRLLRPRYLQRAAQIPLHRPRTRDTHLALLTRKSQSHKMKTTYTLLFLGTPSFLLFYFTFTVYTRCPAAGCTGPHSGCHTRICDLLSSLFLSVSFVPSSKGSLIIIIIIISHRQQCAKSNRTAVNAMRARTGPG